MKFFKNDNSKNMFVFKNETLKAITFIRLTGLFTIYYRTSKNISHSGWKLKINIIGTEDVYPLFQ